jgi:DNA polymerase-3 subunit chi
MTARVDFYVLQAGEPGARLHYACRLAEKAWLLQQTVHIHVDSPAAMAQLDELLWTFRQGSFVPHEPLTGSSVAASPVTIGCGATPPPGVNLLINLAAEVPPFVTDLPRIAEIVDAGSRQAGREHFRHYRALELTPATHNIGGPP